MKNIEVIAGMIIALVLIATTILSIVIANYLGIKELDIDSRAEFVRGVVENFNCENPGEFFLKSGDEVVGYKAICE